MTDEEKAEEYFEKHQFAKDNRNGKQELIHKIIYLDGLAEERKEKCLEQNNDGTIRPCEVMKDNEELKAQIENYQLAENESKEIIAELKKEISVLLSCSNCPDNKGDYICGKEYNDKCLAQKIEYIKELKEQIEKMKCCGNCKHCVINFTNDHGIKHGCKKLERKCDDCILNNYYHWELAE